MRILIAVPTYENIYPDAFKAIYDLDGCGHECLFEFVRGYDIATARNRIVQKAFDLEADYVLMVDNDVVLPKETIRYFLDDVKDVQLGIYAHRGKDNAYDGKTCVNKVSTGDWTSEIQYTADEIKKLKDSGCFKKVIRGGGMGCAFVKTDVFRKIQYPWFDWLNFPGLKRGLLSEDLYFCTQCGNVGIPIFTDTRVTCGHVFRHIQGVE